MRAKTESQTRVGIYADDLTGALDAAAPFAAAGMSTYVSVFGVVPDEVADQYRVLSLNVDTRHGDKFPVFDKAARAAGQLRAAGFDFLVNKIDSTLRGHAGMEARAGLSSEPADPRNSAPGAGWAGPRLALIAPSFPAMGRVVIDRCVRVNGVPLAESEVGLDPLSPVSSSDIVELIEANTGIRPAVVTLDDVRCEGRLKAVVAELVESPPTLAVCEAETDDDLDAIAAAVLNTHTNMRGSVILAGSAGATTALARALSDQNVDHLPRSERGRTGRLRAPVFAVSGSQRSVTERQLKRAAEERNVAWIMVDPYALLAPDSADELRDDTVGRVVQELELGRHVAVSLLRSEDSGAGDGKTRTRLVRELGAICYRVARRTQPGALVLIGGDTAQGALRAAGAAGIVLDAEPFPGIPAGTVDGGLLAGVPIVTKAGAFGDDGVLIDVIDFLGG
ncbi:MAG: hypothetical protein O3C10_13575 [Chloroflexi bacterium]|nr:hypothetical protein [Chloroflexota bacterium]